MTSSYDILHSYIPQPIRRKHQNVIFSVVLPILFYVSIQSPQPALPQASPTPMNADAILIEAILLITFYSVNGSKISWFVNSPTNTTSSELVLTNG